MIIKKITQIQTYEINYNNMILKCIEENNQARKFGNLNRFPREHSSVETAHENRKNERNAIPFDTRIDTETQRLPTRRT